jgi:NAD(P)-dependent dehydrogenase (short-subunit alcohol dehydrogenase family)
MTLSDNHAETCWSEMVDLMHPLTEDSVVPFDIIPVKRPGRTTDMGGLILYLASKAGAYVNGNVSVVDGGRLSLSCSTY